MGLLVHETEGVLFDSICIQANNKLKTFRASCKLIRSLIRTSPFKYENLDSIENLADDAKPTDHLGFYRNPKHLKAFDLHRFQSGSGKGKLENLAAIRTTNLIEASNFPVVSRAIHPDWPKLQWGKQSIDSSVSIWPHPIA